MTSFMLEGLEWRRACATGAGATAPGAIDVLASRTIWDEKLGWERLLADVLAADRGEYGGGTRDARPAVPAH